MRLVSWNVNSLRARLPRLLELLDALRPDVVCLQETKAPPDGFAGLELDAAGYAAVHHSAGGRNGVAILARREHAEPADPAYGLAGEPRPEEARWVEAEVGGLRVASVYVPNGQRVDSEPFAAKLGFLEAMAERASAHDGPLALAGDMNVCLTDRDVYDPAAFAGSTHVTADERARLRTVIAAGGLVDAYRHLHPEHTADAHTWWDYRAGHYHKRLGLRIDLALLDKATAERLKGAAVDRTYRKGAKPSDHAPLVVDLAD